ncbi:alpha/beta hydrolase [Candidatus Roizmanbacteria bacterium]|nr:alpha/beta hydrolase [Candidatus Roizmanbacteria bacterium]
MQFVIFHGSFGSPEGNWLPQLKERLEKLGQTVIAPQFPIEDWNKFTAAGKSAIPKKQTLENWLAFFQKKVLPQLKKGNKLCFIGHSIGPLFILHVVERFNLTLDCAIFVSPFFVNPPKVWQIDLVNKSFYRTDFDFGKLKKCISTSYVLYSDSDPYVNKNQSILFAKSLDSSLILVRKAGHMNSEVNLNEFPLVFDLCTTRLDLSLYQKYLAHHDEKHSSDYLRSGYKMTIHLRPESLSEEGRFHFQNLKESGFATFLSGMKDFNPRDVYFEDGRKAAKRLKYLTRVFLVEQMSDLKRKKLLEQMGLDIEGGINVYLCMLREISKYGREPDFGIWDEDYVCTILYDQKKHMKEFVLDSRKSVLDGAKKWRDIILKKAKRIHNVQEDVERFIKAHSS